MIGLIDVGGGNRGAFGAGVLDYCLDHNIYFDYCIGVSAGSANCVSYIARQRGRNYRFYTKYNISKDAVSIRNRLKTHSVVDLDYIYSTISNEGGLDPVDFKTFNNSMQKCIAVATDAISGKPVYFDKSYFHENQYGALAASSNIPGINQAYCFEDNYYYDGGLSDPIPIKKAIKDGCDKVVVILTLPKTYCRSSQRDRRLSNLVIGYPKIKEAFINRAETYNAELKEILKMEKDGKVLIICPTVKPNMDTLGKNIEEITRVYNEGYSSAGIIKAFIR